VTCIVDLVLSTKTEDTGLFVKVIDKFVVVI
jgi:hypothetical protein